MHRLKCLCTPSLLSNPKLRRRGIAAMMTALVMTFMIPIVGLGFDVTLLYLVRAKLAAASDAAALAAARSLSRGMTLDDQATAAVNKALAFFDGNYPSNYMASTGRTRTAAVDQTSYRLRTVTVNSSATMPLFFLRTLGYRSTTISALSKASRRDVNMILVLDRSGSMANSGSCEPMKTAARNFVSQFANGRDRIGMIAFSTQWLVGYSPNMDFKTTSPTLDTQLSSISCVGGTNTAAGYSEAYNQLVTINEPGSLNLIVLFTDGLPTAFSASFPVKQATDSRLGDGVNPYSNVNSTYSMSPSTCQDSNGKVYGQSGWNPANKRGVLVEATDQYGGTYTLGPIVEGAASLTDSTSETISDKTGCAFANYQQSARRDLAYIPAQDIYTNNLACCYASTENISAGTYAGQIRIDKGSVLQAAAKNAVDNAGTRIRSNTSLGVVTYVIGLGNSSSGDIPDETLMKRIANDPNANNYDSTKQAGFYIMAPTTADLNAAFSKVASEILRIAQ